MECRYRANEAKLWRGQPGGLLSAYVIDRQVRTAHGAEKYLRSGRPIFLDAKNSKNFPFEFNRKTAVIHKIIVAHGAKDACKQESPQHIYGSLAITYKNQIESSGPFHIEIDRDAPIHILDSHNMPIVLRELDTVSDFAAYLDEKIRAIQKFSCLSYCGEEDLLGHFLLNYDSEHNRHVIGPQNDSNFTGVFISEGEWSTFIQSEVYKNTKIKDRVSYFWDELIQRTCQNSLDGTLTGNSDILRGQSAIYEMVKEPRFMRRGLSEKLLSAVERFPDTGQFTRQLTYLPSYEPNVAYIFLQLCFPDNVRSAEDYREKRKVILEIAAGATKNRFGHLKKVIGIAIDAPKIYGNAVAEDFILMPCEEWTEEIKYHYEELNKDWKFFETPNMQQFDEKVTRFVHPGPPAQKLKKIGRNELCPCGSGKKFKKCHG